MFRNLFRKRIKPVFFLTIAFIISVIWFGMPLAHTLTVNNEYRSLAKLSNWEAETGLKSYELTNFTPELIWAYGKPIKVLSKEGSVMIPEESSFGVLVAAEDVELFENTFEGYKFEKVIRYDMNPKGKNDSGHKTRLYRDLYLVSKN